MAEERVVSNEQAIRPGFNYHFNCKHHASNVLKVLYCSRSHPKCFVTIDERCAKAWVQDSENNIVAKVLFELNNPGGHASVGQMRFIVSACYAKSLNMVFFACLDNTLKIVLLADSFKIMDSIHWNNGMVTQMVFNDERQELVTASSYGLRIYGCECDMKGYAQDRNVDMQNMPRTHNGDGVPWMFYRYQYLKVRGRDADDKRQRRRRRRHFDVDFRQRRKK